MTSRWGPGQGEPTTEEVAETTSRGMRPAACGDPARDETPKRDVHVSTPSRGIPGPIGLPRPRVNGFTRSPVAPTGRLAHRRGAATLEGFPRGPTMTEAEWLAATDRRKLLGVIKGKVP